MILKCTRSKYTYSGIVIYWMLITSNIHIIGHDIN